MSEKVHFPVSFRKAQYICTFLQLTLLQKVLFLLDIIANVHGETTPSQNVHTYGKFHCLVHHPANNNYWQDNICTFKITTVYM